MRAAYEVALVVDGGGRESTRQAHTRQGASSMGRIVPRKGRACAGFVGGRAPNLRRSSGSTASNKQQVVRWLWSSWSLEDTR